MIDWEKIKKTVNKGLSDFESAVDTSINKASEIISKDVVPKINQVGNDLGEWSKKVTEETKDSISNFSKSASTKINDWSREGKADNIPAKYTTIVKNALIAAAAAGPLGVASGPADTIAIAGIWATMFVAIREKGNKDFGSDPKRITRGVAAGIVKYYIGCKLATYACFLIPGAGIFAGMSVSAVCNIYFTYNFASILIGLMETKSTYSDDDIINEIISLIKKMPTTEEIKEIVYIYNS